LVCTAASPAPPHHEPPDLAEPGILPVEDAVIAESLAAYLRPLEQDLPEPPTEPCPAAIASDRSIPRGLRPSGTGNNRAQNRRDVNIAAKVLGTIKRCSAFSIAIITLRPVSPEREEREHETGESNRQRDLPRDVAKP
jgi:hypothetical protein